jgi:hypothetical protein
MPSFFMESARFFYFFFHQERRKSLSVSFSQQKNDKVSHVAVNVCGWYDICCSSIVNFW